MTGGRDVEKDIQAIKKAMTETGKAIKLTKGELASLLAGGDQTAINGLINKIASLEKQLKGLSQQRQQGEKDAKAQAQAEKLLAEAKLKEAQATKQQELANKARIQSQIAQEKELDRQIALEQKEQRELQKKKAILDALPGSYNSIRNALNQLRPQIQAGNTGSLVNLGGQQISFEAAIAEFKRLSAAEQDFRRQFAKDGLLVGEYTSGIVQAFSKLNIDDIIKNNVNGAKQQLDSLEKETKDLVVAYRAAQTSGSADLGKLEQKIHANVIETEKLGKAIKDAETQLKGVGGVGTQITNALNKNFKELRNSVAQFALGYVGFQALLGGTQKVFGDTVALDSLDSALRNVSQSETELSVNQQFLAETTNRLGLEYIGTAKAFKNFYAASTQAGIGADSTREIFSAAAEAASSLKLSADDTNGVLLAFSQIASKGKVQAEELRGQIGERIPGAFSIAARAIGVTQAELNKMLEQGQVVASDFLPKFAKELKKTFGTDTNKEVQGLQANINRLKNEFTGLLKDNQGGLSALFSFLIGSVRILIQILPALITLLGFYAAGWALVNAQMLINKGHVLFQRTIMPILIALTGSYSNALKVQAFFANLASTAMGFLAKVMQNPVFKAIAGIVGLSAIALAAFAKSAEKSAVALDQAARKQKFLAEAQTEANKQVSETIAKENVLLSIIRDRTLADQTRQKALNDLKAIMGDYGKALTLENVLTKEGTDAIKAYNEQLLTRAKLTAAQAIAERENQKLSTLFQNQADVESAIRNKGTISTGQLTEQVLEDYYEATGRSASAIGKFLGDKVGIDFTYSGEDLKKFSEVIKKRINEQLQNTSAAELAKLEQELKVPKPDDGLKESVFAAFKRLVDNNGTQEEFKNLLKAVQEQKKTTNALSKEYKDLLKLEKDIKNIINPKQAGAKSSRLTAAEKDQFKEIDALRDQELAAVREYYATNLQLEKDYIRQENIINQDAIDRKIAILEAIKNRNAEQNKVLAELNLERIKNQQDTNRKLFEIDNKELENRLRDQTGTAQQDFNLIDSDPELLEGDRIKARDDFYKKILLAQIVFNQEQIALEKLYSIQSIDNEQKRKEAIEKINKDMNDNLRGLSEARIKDINSASQKAQNVVRKNIAKQVGDILEDENLSDKEKANKIDELEKNGVVGVLANEVAALQRILAHYKELLGEKAEADSRYIEAQADFNEKNNALTSAQQAAREAEITRTGTFMQKAALAVKQMGGFGKVLKSAFGIETFDNDVEKIKGAIQSATDIVKDTINQAYQGYFAAENDRIERSKETQLAFLDREKKRVLATAQSEAERETIERQFEKKRLDAEKKAGEAKQKNALKQATIDYGVALIKTFATYGWPLGLLVAAGLTAAYLVQRSTIKKQQFEKGGQPGVPMQGGDIGGKSHSQGGTPFTYRSRQYEAEKGELSVIRTKNAPASKKYTITGTHRQIASKLNQLGGGVSFASGGAVRKLATGGQLGTDLRPPQFNQGYYSSGVNTAMQASDQLGELKEIVTEVAKAVYATDRKEVQLNPGKVTKAQAKTKKDVGLATI